MIHINSKDSLLKYIEDYCPRKAIVRALLQDGSAELLGGFSPIPPTDRSGWIVRVRSRFGKTWLVVVIPIRKRIDYEIRIIKEVPWANWVGTWGPYMDSMIGSLYYGDRPWVYKTLHERGKK